MSERTDRELLELAARAAGISGGWGEVHALPQGEVDCTDLWLLDGDDYPYVWNPLTDDGDALRLAVKLKLEVSNHGAGTEIWFCDGDGLEQRIE